MFATGVTVITTLKGEQVHGMTANAFMSVSLEPPLVLISVDRRTKLCGMLHEGNHYGVSVLCETQSALSDRFAGRPCEDCPAPRFDLVQRGAAGRRRAGPLRGPRGALLLGRRPLAVPRQGRVRAPPRRHAAAVPRRALRQRGQPGQPVAPAARLLPQHREEGLVHREVAAAAVARVGLVDVGRVEAGVGRDQVGDDRPAVA